MQKKSIIAILSAVVLTVVASLALVFTMGPKTSAASEIVVSSEQYLDIRNGHQLYGLSDEGKSYVGNKQFTLVVPSKVTYIMGQAFEDCKNLVSLVLSQGVTAIKDRAFSRCTNLASISFPSTLDVIDYAVFQDCQSLTSVTLPNNLREIGRYAFARCTSLTSIVIPNSVVDIGDHVFYFCGKLSSIVGPNNDYYTTRDSSGREINALIYKSRHALLRGCKDTEIPSDITSISHGAFSGCGELSSIEIPSSVTFIGEDAFGSTGLTSVNIPSNVQTICSGAFTGCWKLTEIIVENPDLLDESALATYKSAGILHCSQNTVTFDSKNGSSVDEQIIEYKSTATEPDIPVRDGYVFAGWYTDEQYNNAFDFTTPITDNMTLYAKWLGQFTIVFDSKGGSPVDNQVVIEGAIINQEQATTAKEKYSFVGWYRDELYTSLFTLDTPVTESMTLYAKWLEQFTVEFDSNQGSAVDSQIVNDGTNANRPTDPIRSGYTLKNWLLNGEPYEFTTPVTGDITLVADWAENPTITYITNCDTEIASHEVAYGATISAPAVYKDGYKLLGWYLNDEPYNFSTPITEDITLVAEWEKLCVVTFDTDGGYEIEPQYVEKNGYAYFPWTSKAYHDLVGWKLNGVEFDFNNTPITEDITLVADWEIYTYEVIFDSNGGTAVPSQIVDHGAKVILPADPIRDGYFFCGWYRLGYNYYGNYTVTEYDFETPVTEYMTLTAVWKKIYNVVFVNANGEVYTTCAVVEGETVEAPKDITLDGYTLKNWYAGDKVYNFATPVTEDMTLTAEWEVKPEQPEIPAEENTEVNNQNNNALIWGIAGTSAGILVIGGLITGVVIAKRRRK